MLSILAIIIPLLLMIFIIWKRINVIVASLIAAALMAAMSGLNVFESITDSYMSGLSNYVLSYWPLLFLGATFGKAIQLGGGAEDLANMLSQKIGTKYTIPVLTIIALILSYGGVSCYVIVFVMYPICLVMFRNANLPRKMMTGVIAAGAFTFPDLAPGTPSIVNIMPMKYFGTTAYSLPLFSLFLAILSYVLSLGFMMFEEKRARKKGWHFDADEATLKIMSEYATKEHGNGLLALIPMAIVVIPLFFKIDVLYSLLAGTSAVAVIYWKKITDKMEILNCGVGGATTAIMATASILGFGTVAKMTPGYELILNFCDHLGGSPLISFAVAICLLSGATGSGSGGMILGLDMLAPKYIAMGINPGLLHKVAQLSCRTLDSLPHNGVHCTLLSTCGLTHKEGYYYQFMITVVLNLFVLIVGLILGQILYM